MNNYLGGGEAAGYIAPTGGVTAGVPVYIGNLLVLPRVSADEGERFAGVGHGARAWIPKASGALTAGQPLPWDVADVQVNSDYVTNRTPFICLEDAASGDAVVKALLDQALAQGSIEIVHDWILPVANKTVSAQTPVPFSGQVIAGYYRTGAKGTSSSGGLTLSANNPGVSGNNLLSTSTIDLESATNDATTALTLTSTAADKVVAANGVIETKITSDNADLVAGEGVEVWYVIQRT